MALLMRLYMSAQALPDLAMDGEDAPQTDLNSEFAIRLDARISPDYWEIYDPKRPDEAVCGNLVDDLADVASDLQRGIEDYDSGNGASAAFVWKLGLNHHWGKHVVDALRALHSVIRE